MDLHGRNSNVVNVLIVDDSAFMRKVLTDILNAENGINVVGTATDGLDALEKLEQLNPDVLTLDVEMPGMNGIDCLKAIMKTNPKPVIMLGTGTVQGAALTIKALDEGAVDFIAKPNNIFDIKNEKKKSEIVEKIMIAKNIDLSTYNNQCLKYKTNDNIKEPVKYYIAIGSSTGGPKALQQVIPLLPKNLPASVFIVQHMPPGFTKSLAERLDNKSGMTVKEAEHKEKALVGYVYIAPGDAHMVLKKDPVDGALIINLDKSPPVGGHRPSVDVMMSSLSDTGMKNIIGVILTGMGSDGSNGVKKLKENNKSYIIAQDEQSSVVYGMPKMAFQTGVVDKVVALENITEEIIQYLGVRI